MNPNGVTVSSIHGVPLLQQNTSSPGIGTLVSPHHVLQQVPQQPTNGYFRAIPQPIQPVQEQLIQQLRQQLQDVQQQQHLTQQQLRRQYQQSEKTTILGYKVDLLNELGRGGFGTVYKGSRELKLRDDPDNDTKTIEVAMKKVSKNARRKASMEAVRYHYMKQNIDHVNIVKVFDVKSYKDSMWIIMEFCNNGDLNDFFRSNRDRVNTDKFQKKEVVGVMKDMAEGLAFLHDKDIVHRDIKPGNILIKSFSVMNWFTAKLGDFGLSKILDPEDMTSAMSSDVGTMAFKAPEFWDRKPGEKVYYHRNVDVYAAGLTFAAMLQATDQDTELVPRPVGLLRTSETNMAIGLIAFTRQADVEVLDDQSGPLGEHMRDLVSQMTRTSSRDRISADQVLEKLSEWWV